jgi:hypothetical protein
MSKLQTQAGSLCSFAWGANTSEDCHTFIDKHVPPNATHKDDPKISSVFLKLRIKIA